MELRTKLRIVSLNDKGLPSTKCPVLGDMYLAPSLTDPETYDQWIWAGDNLEWQKLGSIPSFDDEKSMREQRVEKVRLYFEDQKRKRREVDRAIAILEAEYYRRQKEVTCA